MEQKGATTAPVGVPSACKGKLPGAEDSHDEILMRLDKHVAPHVESFNYFATEGLVQICQHMRPIEFGAKIAGHTTKVHLRVEALKLQRPMRGNASDMSDDRLLPAHCREENSFYGAPLSMTVAVTLDDGRRKFLVHRIFSNFPVMVRSVKCHLQGLSPRELVSHKEEPREFGGTFICNGNERVIRLLQMQRRNHPLALNRPSFAKKGSGFTSFGCSIRCVRGDQLAATNVLHYVKNGSVMVRFSARKREYFIPVVQILKALRRSSDREILEQIVRASGEGKDKSFSTQRIEMMLRESKELGLKTRGDYLAHIGSMFRDELGSPSWHSDAVVGECLIKRYILIHLSGTSWDAPQDFDSKFNLMIIMIGKLYALARSTISEDNADALSNQEILLPGHLFNMIVGERAQDILLGMRAGIERELRQGKMTKAKLGVSNYFQNALLKQKDLTKGMQYFLATGNLDSRTGLDLMQDKGFVVNAEKLNYYRYLSHFRAVHRGAFFTTMRTTTVRKLLPESWGFMCPVHTPDGSPCGLLNHITLSCAPIGR